MRTELWEKAGQAREKALEALRHVPAERLPETPEVLRELRAVRNGAGGAGFRGIDGGLQAEPAAGQERAMDKRGIDKRRRKW